MRKNLLAGFLLETKVPEFDKIGASISIVSKSFFITIPLRSTDAEGAVSGMSDSIVNRLPHCLRVEHASYRRQIVYGMWLNVVWNYRIIGHRAARQKEGAKYCDRKDSDYLVR